MARPSLLISVFYGPEANEAMTTEGYTADLASASTRFWIGFATAVLPLLAFLATLPWSARNAWTFPIALLASPSIGWLLVRLFRPDARRVSLIDVTLAVWAVLWISAPFALVAGLAVPFLVFGAALWGTQWKGRHRGAVLLLVGVLTGLYWAWTLVAP